MLRLVVVDDSMSVRRAVEVGLKSRGFEVLSASTLEEGREMITRERPHVVLCDVIIGANDGFALCSWIQTQPQLADIPVIMISGIVNDGVRARASDAKAVGVLAKPFKADLLAEEVKRVMAEAEAKVAARPAQKAAPASGSKRASTIATGLLEKVAQIEHVRFCAIASEQHGILDYRGADDFDRLGITAAAVAILRQSMRLSQALDAGGSRSVVIEMVAGLLVPMPLGNGEIFIAYMSQGSALRDVRVEVRAAIASLGSARPASISQDMPHIVVQGASSSGRPK
jgi:CheY-like chemotaxis protein/predicted regulator of Ras-like GTPase activity (Roadblock/LC7/MglB family)